jgi:hypothetical protein
MAHERAKKYLEDNPGSTYQFAADKYGISRSALSRYMRGITISREQYRQQCDRKLTQTQEKQLVKHIKTLTNRGWAPTYPMVRRFAKEISKKSVGKNWPAKFVNRNRKDLATGFLEAIEIARKKADSVKGYQRWFNQVFDDFWARVVSLVLIYIAVRRY